MTDALCEQHWAETVERIKADIHECSRLRKEVSTQAHQMIDRANAALTVVRDNLINNSSDTARKLEKALQALNPDKE